MMLMLKVLEEEIAEFAHRADPDELAHNALHSSGPTLFSL